MISSSARSDSPAESGSPAAAFPRVSAARASLQEVLEQLPTALREDALGVELDALDGQLLCLTPMITPSSVRLVTVRHSGTESGSMTSEW
jgi:hypothetical protein